MKEISNILRRVNEREKEEVLNLARGVLDKSFCHGAEEVDRELRNRSGEELKNSDNMKKMSVRAIDFEKTVTLIKILAGKMDFEKKFRMELEYDPELLSVMINFWS